MDLATVWHVPAGRERRREMSGFCPGKNDPIGGGPERISARSGQRSGGSGQRITASGPAAAAAARRGTFSGTF